MCHLSKDLFDISQDIDFIAHQSAPTSDIQAYEHEDGPGPNIKKQEFDLSRNHSTPWNNEVFKILLQKFGWKVANQEIW